MHGRHNYPLRKEQSDLDVDLEDGIEDDGYMSLLQEHLPDGCRIRDRYVFELCQRSRLPVAVSMGGGYSTQIRDIVEAHANTFRVAQEMYF